MKPNPLLHSTTPISAIAPSSSDSSVRLSLCIQQQPQPHDIQTVSVGLIWITATIHHRGRVTVRNNRGQGGAAGRGEGSGAERATEERQRSRESGLVREAAATPKRAATSERRMYGAFGSFSFIFIQRRTSLGTPTHGTLRANTWTLMVKMQRGGQQRMCLGGDHPSRKNHN